MNDELLQTALRAVPSGPWAVGVSGGADSVALLAMLRGRVDVRCHVVHLDHETRGPESTADAHFVAALAVRWGMPCTVARRAMVERRAAGLPANPSARFRALRLALFREVVAASGLHGVLLAHHAGDQAETVLARLLRGSGYAGLAGMSAGSTVGGLLILRPLLDVRRHVLRQYLESIGQTWREDASNASDRYQRNRLRKVLAGRPDLVEPLLSLASSCRRLRDWVHHTAPGLGAAFAAARLRVLPPILAHESARRWLLARGIPPSELARNPAAVDRLVEMATDAASPPRQSFPGGVRVRRKRGALSVEA